MIRLSKILENSNESFFMHLFKIFNIRFFEIQFENCINSTTDHQALMGSRKKSVIVENLRNLARSVHD